MFSLASSSCYFSSNNLNACVATIFFPLLLQYLLTDLSFLTLIWTQFSTYSLFFWCYVGIVILLDLVETCCVVISVERLLLLDCCPQVVSGPDSRIQPYQLSGDLCSHLGSIPKIDWFSCSVHVLFSISLMLLSSSRYVLITKWMGSSLRVLTWLSIDNLVNVVFL